MQILMKILKTDKELAREARNELIVEKFVKMREEFPGAPLNRIFNNLSSDPEIRTKGHSLTAQTIRNVCKSAGVC